MTREPFGCAITVLHPHITSILCKLRLSRYGNHGDHHHYQHCEFAVGCSDLADGLPDPKHCFQFLVPRCFEEGDL
ncbi:hypothetical protein E2562_017262 [Oryza meyeriana var. granulata]|uniref:Uncharacterized protein n=1 Tax=Oryza meyeriana var. granulata TaxID=110450 RepID=A0A6G1ELJ2_9ORYZ|nr:hypothetical protein E2562_017262 [Oryza meyeriana var. granulata]